MPPTPYLVVLYELLVAPFNPPCLSLPVSPAIVLPVSFISPPTNPEPPPISGVGLVSELVLGLGFRVKG